MSGDRPAVGDFAHTRLVSTRWADNDSYGHLNNAVHYQLFDSVINEWIADVAPSAVADRRSIGVVAESGCTYFAELTYPDDVLVGLRVERLGTSSVTYALGLFPQARRPDATPGALAATGRWVHVYVDAVTRRPVPVPEELRSALEALKALLARRP